MPIVSINLSDVAYEVYKSLSKENMASKTVSALLAQHNARIATRNAARESFESPAVQEYNKLMGVEE